MKQKRWRLILGKQSDDASEVPLSAEEMGVDKVMEALYDSNRKGSLGSSSPNINRWLGDIRKYFPQSMVQLMQRDALDRLGLNQMLLEPELLASVEPDVHLVGTLLLLNKALPDKTRATAREVVRRVVQELEKKLVSPFLDAVKGALNHSEVNRRPKLNEINWHRTIQKNLKHYQAEQKVIIPENVIGYGSKTRSLSHVILMMDQSGSMASSVVYSSVFGAALASMKSVKTHLVAFDTAVVDLSEHLADPVELLFGTQLGGGTDIAKALGYVQQLLTQPSKTIIILISDLFEGGNRVDMIRRMQYLKESGATVIVLLALDDAGAPAFDRENAAVFAEMGIPSVACTPQLFPEILSAAIRKTDLMPFSHR